MKIRSIKGFISVSLVTVMLCGTVSGCGVKASYDLSPSSDCSASTDVAIGYKEIEDDKVYYGAEVYEESEAPASEACEEGNYDTYSESAEDETLYVNYLRDDNDKKGSYLDDIYDYDHNSHSAKNSDNEEYSELNEQGYRSVKAHPLSTFAADVDTASYSNLRRMLSDGYDLDDIPEGAVRIEEMLNYFNYDYKGPKGDEPFGVNTEMAVCPWNKDAYLLSIGLKTEDIDFDQTPDSNLVFLIDISGSMNRPDKLPLLQESFCMLVDELSEKDRVSIVTYANGVNVVLEGASGNNKRKIKNAINDLFASGGTNGGEGIKTAYKLAEENFIKGGNNRIILATDGDLNLGLTSVDELHDLVSRKKQSGVYLSVLGFGTGNIKDNRMETLADNGNGNYSYIDSEREAKKVLIDELSANMLTVCKDVKLQVEFDPEVVKGYRLVGYANRVMKDKDFDNDKKDGGEIGAGHEVTVLYELIPTKDYENISYNTIDEILTLSVRYKKPSENKSRLLEYPISFKAYTERPTDDFLFKSAVAEFGLLASDSLFSADADLDNVLERLGSIRLDDGYKREFADLVSNLE